MARWPTRTLKRVTELVREEKYRLTLKATQELDALGMNLEPEDVGEVLLALRPQDAVERVRSHQDDAWLYIFRPEIQGLTVYLKFRIRDDCVVISFHEFH